jgi:hypothetical protein
MKQLDLKDYIKRYAGKLLGSNFKLKKSDTQTRGLSLLPHKLAIGGGDKAKGFDLCPSSTEGCRRTCIYQSGNAMFKGVNEGRYQKTRFFFEHKRVFLNFLEAELSAFRGAVRLNVFSDVPWEHFLDMESMHWIQFYDYTKIVRRYDNFLKGVLPKNYHLTFSYSGENGGDCLNFLSVGGVVSIVVKGRKPKTFGGYPCIDGDDNDMRWKDPAGHVVVLKYKNSMTNKDANKTEDNPFVVKEGETMFNVKSN